MKQRPKLYNFPFQEIQNFLDADIDNMLEAFYKSFQNEFIGHRIKDVDRERREVQILKDFYSEGEFKYRTHNFENEIRPHFLRLIYHSIDIISEGINISFISNRSVHGFLDKIERQARSIKKHRKLNDYPLLREDLFLLTKEIESYRNLDNVAEENRLFKDSPFRPIIEKRSFYYRLYDFVIFHEFIEENIPREDFIDVFTSPFTKKTLTFKRDNMLVVTFFEVIAQCFENLTPTAIGKSERFYTKQNKLFSTGSYYSTKNRIRKNQTLEVLQEELKALVSEHK